MGGQGFVQLDVDRDTNHQLVSLLDLLASVATWHYMLSEWLELDGVGSLRVRVETWYTPNHTRRDLTTGCLVVEPEKHSASDPSMDAESLFPVAWQTPL